MKMVWGLLSTDISILERGLTMAKGKREKESREVTSWRPFFEMSRWEREMDRQFGDFFERRLSPFRGRHWWPSGGVGVSVPAVDLYEDKDEIVVKVELPGMEKDDIDVDLTDDWLTIKGEKKKEEEKKEEDYYCCERFYGSFSRSVDLPKEVQVEKARASFKNDVLEIRLPKTEEARKKGDED